MEVLFIYIGVVDGFSGQAAATELIIDGLVAKGVRCRKAHLPHLKRTSGIANPLPALGFFGRLAGSYWKLAWTRLPPSSAIHLSLGLTRFGLIRDSTALQLANLFNFRSLHRVVALNGSVFTGWPTDSFDARLFRWLINRCDVVTCVGDSHRQALERLGIDPGKIVVIRNVCEYSGVAEADVRTKQLETKEPVEILYLSTLTDTKGYPEYLEALEIMSRDDGPSVKAVLCGPIVADAFRKRFSTVEAAKQWIKAKLIDINQSARIRAEWIPGAWGSDKEELFKRAQIFVLPTRYPVEAQPLAVIEAMAHGCAIITSAIGELPSTVSDDCAVILKDPTTEKVKDAIDQLLNSPEKREMLGLSALHRFKRDFDKQQYIQQCAKVLRVEKCGC